MTDEQELKDLRLQNEMLVSACKAFSLSLLGKRIESLERERIEQQTTIAALTKRCEDLSLSLDAMRVEQQAESERVKERLDAAGRAVKELQKAGV